MYAYFIRQQPLAMAMYSDIFTLCDVYRPTKTHCMSCLLVVTHAACSTEVCTYTAMMLLQACVFKLYAKMSS